MGNNSCSINSWLNWDKHIFMVRKEEEKIRIKKVIYFKNVYQKLKLKDRDKQQISGSQTKWLIKNSTNDWQKKLNSNYFQNIKIIKKINYSQKNIQKCLKFK